MLAEPACSKMLADHAEAREPCIREKKGKGKKFFLNKCLAHRCTARHSLLATRRRGWREEQQKKKSRIRLSSHPQHQCTHTHVEKKRKHLEVGTVRELQNIKACVLVFWFQRAGVSHRGAY